MLKTAFAFDPCRWEKARKWNYQLFQLWVNVLSKVSLWRWINALNKKSKLKTFLLKKDEQTHVLESTRTVEGAAHLWCCNWKKWDLCEKYSSLLNHYSVKIVLFDGYVSLTEDVIHRKKLGQILNCLNIGTE